MIRLRRIAAVAGLALFALLQAAPSAQESGYLDPAEIPDMTRLLPAPPTPKSPEGRADASAFRASRRFLNSPRWAMATSDARYGVVPVFADFSCAVGVELDPAALPTLARIFARVSVDGRRLIDPAKDHWARRRPLLDLDGPICLPRDESLMSTGSYPSGHTTMGWAWALVLAELAPDRAGEILQRGRAYGESRVVCGVHYPTDVESGRITGATLVSLLHANPDFRTDMDRAREELAKVRADGRPPSDPQRCKIEAEAGAHRPW